MELSWTSLRETQAVKDRTGRVGKQEAGEDRTLVHMFVYLLTSHVYLSSLLRENYVSC